MEKKKILELFDKDFKGVYVDLGCFHPTRSNNTLEMFKKGWYGLNIDLNPLTIDLFNYARPSDINICSAISNKKTKKKLFFLGDFDSKKYLKSQKLVANISKSAKKILKLRILKRTL